MYSDKHEIPNTATIAEEELKARRQAALNNEFTQSANEVHNGPITAETPMAGSAASSQVESSSRYNSIVRNHKVRSALAAIVAAGGLAYGIDSLVSGSSSSKSVAGDAYKGAVASCGGSTIGQSDFTDPAEILPSAARVASAKDANKFNKALFDNELGTLGHTIVPGTEATMYSLLGYPGLRGGINSETDLSRIFKGAYDKMTEGSKNSREQAAAAICAKNQVVMGHVVSFGSTAITKGEEVTQIVPLLNKATGQIIGETQKQFLSPQNYAGVVWKFANAGSDSSLHNFYEVIEPTSTNGQIYVEGLPEQKPSTTSTTTPVKHSTTSTTTPVKHSTPPTTSQSSAQVGNQSPSLSINGNSPEGKQCGVTCTPGSSSTPPPKTTTTTTAPPPKTTTTTTAPPPETTTTTTAPLPETTTTTTTAPPPKATTTTTAPTQTTTTTTQALFPPSITTFQYEGIYEGASSLFCVDVSAGGPNESVESVSASLTGPDGGSIGSVVNEGNGEYCVNYESGVIGIPNVFYINWSATNNVGLVANATEQNGIQQPQQ